MDARKRAEKVAVAERLKHEAENGRADAERQRAESERQATHDARVTAARQLARRGDWQAGVKAFDRAIADTLGDRQRLRVERLVGYFGLNRTNELTAELAALQQESLGENAAQLNLLLGTWEMCDSLRRNRGRELIRKALQQREHLYSPADVAFAEALVADRFGERLASLRRAVSLDPLHYLAAASLGMGLIAVGERDEARRQAAFLEGMFPYSPISQLVLAHVAFLDRDRDAMKRHLADVAKKLPAEAGPKLTQAEQTLSFCLDACDLLNQQNGPPSPLTMVGLVAKLASIKGKIGTGPYCLPVPTVGWFEERFLAMGGAFAELIVVLPFNPQGVIEKINLRIKDYPDAFLLHAATGAQLMLSSNATNSGDLERLRTLLHDVADTADRAMRASTVLEVAGQRYQSRLGQMVADAYLLRLGPEPDPIRLGRLCDNTQGLIRDGSQDRAARAIYASAVIQVMTASIPSELLKDWHLDEPTGRAAHRQRHRELHTVAQVLLDLWSLDEPQHPKLPELRKLLADFKTAIDSSDTTTAETSAGTTPATEPEK